MRILYLYSWKFTDIEKELGNIYIQGFDAIQISTIQTLRKDRIENWWDCLITSSYNMGNFLGGKSEFISLCETAKNYNIKIIVSIIPPFIQKNSVSPLSDMNSYLLTKRKKYILSEEAQVEIYYLIYKLIHYGIEGIFLNFNQIEFSNKNNIFLEDVSSFLQNHNIEYLNILHYKEKIYQNYIKNEKIRYIEIPYSYFDFNFGYTNIFPSDKITKKYQELCKVYPNTLYYPRPFDDEWRSFHIKDSNDQEKKYIKK